MPRPPERPSQLPAERSRMVSLVLEADAPTGMAHHLAVADLYWVTRDMAHAALDASTDIPGWSIESLPAPYGLMAFEPGSLPALPLVEGRALGVRHAAWAEGVPDSARVAMVQWAVMGDMVGVVVWADASGVQGRPEGVAGVMIESIISGVTDVELEDLESMQVRVSGRRVLALLGACVSMMMVPTVAEARPQSVRLSGRVAGRLPRVQAVTTVSLRRLARRPHEDEAGESGRAYAHQWVVRGHWRQQPHGPGRSLRRTTWVPSYVKGPEGAPLLHREHVQVWRR